MSSDVMLTEDKILMAAAELFQEKGFHAVSMKNIAGQANVSEMTVFRHFSSKKQVLEAVIKKLTYDTYIFSFQEIFEKKICWELETDLLLICETYQHIMYENRSVFLITMREEKTIPEITEFIRQGPPQFESFLQQYFSAMMEREKIIPGNVEALALNFMAVNFGYFFFKMFGHKMINISDSQYIETAVQLFAKGIKCKE